MAQPTYYPLWATEDTTLPNTDQTNKIRPKTTLRETGWDKGQIPSAEEFNWQLNNIYQWVKFINEESLPLYLPKTGTELNFTGDISGTATWDGDTSTSVELSSATLNAATSSNTANTLVKRSSTGGISVGRAIAGYAPAGQNFDYQMFDGTTNTQAGAVAWSRSDGVVTIYKGTTGNQVQWIRMYSDRTEISNPRSSSSQGSNDADLTRKDYVDLQISNLNTSLTNYVNGRSTSSFSQNGWWKDVNTGMIIQWGWAPAVIDDSYVTITLPITFPNSFYSVNVTPVHSAAETDRNSIGAFANIINTSSFAAGATSDGDPGATINGAYWIAMGR